MSTNKVVEPAYNKFDNAYEIEFDHSKGSSKVGCSLCVGLCCTGLCIPCSPFGYFWGKKLMQNQTCTVDDYRINLKQGYFNKEDKMIPLDRIQDVNIKASWYSRLFGVSQIAIQTAGGMNPDGTPEGLLESVKDPKRVRDIIIGKRDKLVHEGAPGSSSSNGNGLDGGTFVNKQPAKTSDPSVLKELIAIKDVLHRMENNKNGGL
ncbi:hypothetical protein HDU92_005326 [Lobulomyces angularis]|nr:hypothetical protein HDU92_005326 [Lobulomyces angularis]